MNTGLDATDVIDVVVLEESNIKTLLADPDQYLDVIREAQLAIAFSHVGAAIEFQEMRKTHAVLEEVGLLPLNAQIDVWIAVRSTCRNRWSMSCCSRRNRVHQGRTICPRP